MVASNKRVKTPLEGKSVPALRVAPEKVPLGVARCSFEATKPRASRLDWRFFRRNSDKNETSTDPSDAQALEIDKNVKSSHVISIENKYNAAIEKDAVKFKDLPAEAQTVIASVSFQYGINLQRKAPLFWKAVTSQDWKETGSILDNFGDAYNSRRKLESELIKKIKNDN